MLFSVRLRAAMLWRIEEYYYKKMPVMLTQRDREDLFKWNFLITKCTLQPPPPKGGKT